MGNAVFTLSRNYCLFPITWSTEKGPERSNFYSVVSCICKDNIAYQNLIFFSLHNPRKSSLLSLLSFASSWMRIYTSCDDVTQWRRAVFDYAVNGEKEGDPTQSYDKTPYTNRKFENQRTTHTNATKNFDYTTIADRLRTVSWSNK